MTDNVATIKAEDVFKVEDFQSIRLSIQFKNFTTNTDVKDAESVSLIEIRDKALVFEVPNTACNLGHNVMASLRKTVPGNRKPQHVLDVTGKVIEAELLEPKVVRITVECIQYDEQSWKNLIALFSKRQEEINAFMTAAKGV